MIIPAKQKLAAVYRTSGRLVKEKLKSKGYFLSPSERRLYELIDRHKGQKAVIIGMGPSFSMEDVDLLKGFVTFACNKIYLGFDNTDWRPDYYSVCDMLVAENNYEAIINSDFGAAIPLHARIVSPFLAKQKNALFYNRKVSMQNWRNDKTIHFKTNFLQGMLGDGCSVLIDQIQIAYIMGFSEVYVIGVDFDFDLGNVTETISRSGRVIESVGERNHFHKDYRKPGETWTMPKLDELRNAFEFCENEFRNNGRRLINASRKSKLDVLPKVDFESVFSK